MMHYKRLKGLLNKRSEYKDYEQLFEAAKFGMFQLRQGIYRGLLLLAVILLTVILWAVVSIENGLEEPCSSLEEK